MLKLKIYASGTGVSELSTISLQMIKRISDMLAQSTNCTCVLQEILISIVEETKINLAAVFLKDESEDIFILSCSHPKRFQRYKDFFKRDQFACCFNNYEYFINQFESDHRNYYVYSLPLPFQFDKKTDGLLVLINNEAVFSEEDLSLLGIFANQIGLSIENEILNEKGRNLSYSSLKVLDSLTEGVMIINQEQIIFSNSKLNSLLGCKQQWTEYPIDFFCEYLQSIAKEKINIQLALDTLRNHSINDYRFFLEIATGRFLRIKKFLLGKSQPESTTWGIVVSDYTQYKNSDKLKDELIATVSHELRTPLTSIKGNTSALLRTDIVWPLEDQLLFLQDIYEEADKLNDLIGKLLDFSKISAGALRIDPDLITINKFIANLTKQLAKRYKDNFQYITLNIETNDEMVKVDEQRLFQVFFNLIDNAFKHNSDDIPISIHAKLIDYHILFSVTDKGKGIPRKNLNHLFDKYYQRDDSPGLGLGLAICKGFISAHNGEIWAESCEGFGSSFYFTIPIARG